MYPERVKTLNGKKGGVAQRDREGWLLLTVETEVSGDSKRTNDKVPSLDMFVGPVMPVQEIFVLPYNCSK
jgi:hypothetical protein